MPLFRRKPLPILPMPAETRDGHLGGGVEVFFLKETGECFLDYDAYAARIDFLRSNVFTCEATGKSGHDYFSALASEAAERKANNARFPEPLKGRILRAVHLRVHNRIDDLAEIIYERYHDRFFENENCFVEVEGQRYLCTIKRLYPPKQLRDLAAQRSAAAGQSVETVLPPNCWGNSSAYGAVAHVMGVDLDTDGDEADRRDTPADYLYTVQLADENGAFEGSSMEVRGRSLTRDRLGFSKLIVKKFLRNNSIRSAHPGSTRQPAWRIKPSLVDYYGLPAEETADIMRRNEMIRAGKVAKRRAWVAPERATPPPSKRKRGEVDSRESSVKPASNAAAAKPKPEPRPRTIRYPIEDLELDAGSTFDGRLLRRVNTELPPLPTKPTLETDLGVPQGDVEAFLLTWSFLNVFGSSLGLSSFTLDDYGRALQHSTREPRCTLIAEIHGVLLNEVVSSSLRLTGTTVTTSTGPMPPLAAEGQEDGLTSEARERFIRRALSFARKWDRSARLKSAEGRARWERHMIGALCQKGGLETVASLPRILKHLFAGDDGTEKTEEEAEEGVEAGAAIDAEESIEASEVMSEDTRTEVTKDEERVVEEGGVPAVQYWTLSVSDKLDILTFLCHLVLGSRKMRAYLDECEAKLTELRKEHVDLNRERKALMAQKLAFEIEDEKAGASARKKARYSNANETTNGDAQAGPVEPSSSPLSAVPNDRSEEADELAMENGDEEIDELASSSDASDGGGGGTSTAARQAALKERLAQRETENKAVADAKRERRRLEEHLHANAAAEEEFEREFRKLREVSRTKPLGQDRFFCSYWWLDGIGSMDLVGPGRGAVYASGRVIVQGPTKEEWDAVLAGDHGSEQTLEARRVEEEGAEATRLRTGEWAAISTEEELDQLLAWLNVKGNRESKLKETLTKWRPHIVAGMAKRQRDQRDPPDFNPRSLLANASRSSARAKGNEPDATPAPPLPAPVRPSAADRYLVWYNRDAQM